MNVSVVINTYNNANLLASALESVANQSYRDFELVIVDDGSTDTTAAVVQLFASRFRDFTCLRKPHTGLADSRNVALRAAKGHYIAIIDSDDVWNPDYLGVMAEVFQRESGAELVACDGVRVREPGGQILRTLFPPRIAPVQGPLQSWRAVFSFFPHLTPSGTIFSRDLFDRVGEYDLSLPQLGHDWKWLLQAILLGAYCIRVDQKLVTCRNHGANLTLKSEDMFAAWLRVYGQLLGPQADAEAQHLGGTLARSCLLPVLLRASAARCRSLTQAAANQFPSDPWLRIAHMGTYCGLPWLLAKTARLKRSLLGSRWSVPAQRGFCNRSGGIV